MRPVALACLALAISTNAFAQPAAFTRADTIRGSNGPGRAWWDAEFYDLHVTVNPADSSILGRNGITYRVLRPARDMQIDLQPPMQIDSIVQDNKRLAFRRDGNAFTVRMPPQRAREQRLVTVYYHGKPVAAKRPPWDGGFIWQRDSLGNRFIATANEGLGASVWWPNKDIASDEPDSQRVAITVPDSMVNVSNGRLRSVTRGPSGTTTWEWFVSSPINNYNIAVNAGRYAHFTDYYVGERGTLSMDYYPLAIHEDTARVQFRQALPMMRCFERWFGPFPWYEDGFKLVEAPHLGMEHQSAVAYGNKYKNGYLGRDLSATGRGLKWDFIIIHEAAHEWWGNNISAADHADMWVHESFANYAEGLYTECQDGKAAGAEYIIGSRVGIRNDKPIIPLFGVNAQGSGDMYPKGGNMLHTIRHVIDNDEKWRGILRGLNHTFWHQTVSGKQVQDYISREAGIDFTAVFAQYLTTTRIPVFEYQLVGTTLSYRWTGVVPGFSMPLPITTADSSFTVVRPTGEWQTIPVRLSNPAAFAVDRNFYVITKNSGAPPP